MSSLRAGLSKHRRAYRGALVTLAALATTAAVIAPGAQGALPSVDATCAGIQTITSTPGLTLKSQPITATTSANATCVAAHVRSVSMHGSAAGSLSCLGGSVSGLLEFDWVLASGGTATSVVTVSSSQRAVIGGAGLSGTVTDGLFAGDNVLVTFVQNPVSLLDCLSPSGLTTLKGAATIVFTSPLR